MHIKVEKFTCECYYKKADVSANLYQEDKCLGSKINRRVLRAA